jgi:hypothetical protein
MDKKKYYYFFVLLLVIVSLSVYVNAGTLTANRAFGDTGTTFTILWRQGCSAGSLGPNFCSPTLPWYCPISSIGSTSLVQNSALCGCPANSRPDSNGIGCVSCPDPCDNCPSGTCSCTSPADWCTGAPICNPCNACPYDCKSSSQCNADGGTARSGYDACGGGDVCCEAGSGGGSSCTGDWDCPNQFDYDCRGNVLYQDMYRGNCRFGVCENSIGDASRLENSIEWEDCNLVTCPPFGYTSVCSASTRSCEC